jgi:hypothetical protein
LFPSNSTTLSFKSILGYADSDEVARVQISTDTGTSWQDIFTEAGSGGRGETTFTQHTLSLSNYVGQSVLLRFDYDIITTGFYSWYNSTSANTGWCLENVIVTNCQQLVNQMTNAATSTNFVFTPAQIGNYVMQVRGITFNTFPINFAPAKSLTVIAAPTSLRLDSLTVAGSQVKINFTLTSGTASSFHLLQAGQPNGLWTTNTAAVLTTDVPGSSYQFTTTNTSAVQFYRVMTP